LDRAQIVRLLHQLDDTADRLWSVYPIAL